MKRLVDHGLIYGNLFRVNTPVMRERYNAALEALTGKTTALQEFHVDLSGLSPEVGDELSDPLYLNPNGCNRQFILLSIKQRECPLIDAHFSTTRSILRQFIDDNYARLMALTARDAVMGELDNSTWRIDDIVDVVTIRNITMRVDTSRGLIANAEELKTAIRNFHESETDWWDDAVLERMCTLAETVGDIKRHPVVPEVVHYRKRNFHTTHFGGLYVFRDTDEPTLITCDPEFDRPVPASYRHIRMDDAEALSSFLREAGYVENVLDVSSLDHKALLQERVDFMLIDLLSALEDGPDLSTIRRADFRRAARWHFGELPAAFESLSDVVRSLEQNVPVKDVDPGDAGHFYLMRAAGNEDRDLVNHLLARLTPLDFRQLFICNKELFYTTYQSWPETKRTYVSQFLAKTFMVDSHGEWERLYAGTGVEDAPGETEDAGSKSAIESVLKVINSRDWTGGLT
jgi:hypothetical protein